MKRQGASSIGHGYALDRTRMLMSGGMVRTSLASGWVGERVRRQAFAERLLGRAWVRCLVRTGGRESFNLSLREAALLLM